MKPKAYALALHTQLTYLFSFARTINEIDTAAALFGEFRGAQDVGWSTVQTAYEVFGELKRLGSKGSPLTKPELRQVLCLYAQLAEAGGVYECLLNTMSVMKLKAYNLWPFQSLVRVRQEPRAVIGPNANATFRHLAKVATAIGMTGLARLFEITFRDDIRNGMAHADYILGPDGLRLRRRNGGSRSSSHSNRSRTAYKSLCSSSNCYKAFSKQSRRLTGPRRPLLAGLARIHPCLGQLN
ncbi:hypothetical protein [Herbaspirillum sp. GW103]|uniref:hypothetical protein n=1 Tax=Herbaspirillum sp. GW103 TaxID=1175306 RepID=UPI000553102E|nr:hypothetical protein [Herbaspirillum sp. GW103]